MKRVVIAFLTLCLSTSVFAQFALGGRVGFNFNGVSGQKDFIDLLPARESDRKYFGSNPMGFDAELFTQYDFGHFGFELDFAMTTSQGLDAKYERKVERTKTIYIWNLYADYVTYEVSPMLRLYSVNSDKSKVVLSAGPNFVYTKDTTRFGEDDKTIKTEEALQETFNYGLRAGLALEAPLNHSMLSMGISSVFDFKNAYKDIYNKVLFQDLLKKRMGVNLYFGFGYLL